MKHLVNNNLINSLRSRNIIIRSLKKSERNDFIYSIFYSVNFHFYAYINQIAIFIFLFDFQIKTTSTDQDALAISAQNCFIRATELTESAKNAASCTASLLSSNPDLSIEGQVQLLTSTRDVVSGLVRLLNHGKSISAVCYAIEFWNDQTDDTLNSLMKTKQKALNDTAVQVIETISSLSNSLRSISDMFTVAKSPTVKDENPPISPIPPAVPLKKVSLKVSAQKFTSLDKKTDHAKSNVHTSLESIITILSNLNERLNKWDVKDGLLHTPGRCRCFSFFPNEFYD